MERDDDRPLRDNGWHDDDRWHEDGWHDDERPRSRLRRPVYGTASFVVALVSAVGMFAAVLVAGIMEETTPGGMDENSPEAMAVGMAMLGFAFLSVVAFGLGVAGIMQKERKVMGVLGIVFSSATVVGTIGLVILGLMVG